MKTIHLFALAIGAAGLLAVAAPLRAATETDKAINDKIFHLLLNNRSLAKGSGKITATIQDGQVTLVGDTTTAMRKDELQKAIAGVPGVQHVNDKQLIPKTASPDFGSD